MSAFGYDSAYEVFVTVDTLGNRALVHRLDGSYLGACSLPNWTPQQRYWNMGYANGQVFVFDVPTNEWWGYRIFGPSSVTLASTSALTYSLFSTSVIANDDLAGRLRQSAARDSGLDPVAARTLDSRSGGLRDGRPFLTSIGRELTSIDVGQGYWLATKSPKSVLMIGFPVMSGFEDVLQNGPGGAAGWNQLGNPLLNAVAVSALRVRSGSTTIPLVDPTNGFTDHAIWTWNGSQYTSLGAGATLPKGAGFWLRKTASGDVRLVFEGPGPAQRPPPPRLPRRCGT